MSLAPNMLTGYRVLDITQFVAGPTCTRLLAEAGADVIKIELAPTGDRSRFQGLKPRSPEYRNTSQSTYFFQQNHSKKSLALDFKHPKSRELLRKLAAKCDVLVENFTPGVMARAGLGYEDLKKINPKIIMCSISFAGQTGPLSDKPGYDYIAQALAGITGVIGEPDGQAGAGADRDRRCIDRCGCCDGGRVRTCCTASGPARASSSRRRWSIPTFTCTRPTSPRSPSAAIPFVPQREGSLHPNGGPVGIFDCGRDEFIVICALAHQWPQMVKALGMPELEKDPRFASRARPQRQQ